MSKRPKSCSSSRHDARFPISKLLKKEHRIDYERNVLVVKVFAAKALKAADANGFSDPYVLVEFNGTRLKSSVKKRNLFPSWNETFVFSEVNTGDFDENDRIFLQIKDHDYIGFDDNLGGVVISLSNIIQQSMKILNDNQSIHTTLYDSWKLKEQAFDQQKSEIETEGEEFDSDFDDSDTEPSLEFPSQDDYRMFDIGEEPLTDVEIEVNGPLFYYNFKPKWFDIKDMKGASNSEGRIKLGFEFHPQQKHNKASKRIIQEIMPTVPTKEDTKGVSNTQKENLWRELKLQQRKRRMDKRVNEIRKAMLPSDLVISERPTLDLIIHKASYYHTGKSDTKLFVRIHLQEMQLQTTFKTHSYLIWNEIFKFGQGVDLLLPSDIIKLVLCSKTRFGSISEIGELTLPLWRFMSNSPHSPFELKWYTLEHEQQQSEVAEFNKARLLIQIKFFNPLFDLESSNLKLTLPTGRVQFYNLKFRPVAVRNICKELDKEETYYGIVLCGNTKGYTESVTTSGFPIFNSTIEFDRSGDKGISYKDSLLFQLRRIIKKPELELDKSFEDFETKPKTKVIKGSYEVIASIIIDIGALMTKVGAIDNEGRTIVDTVRMINEQQYNTTDTVLKYYLNLFPIDEQYYEHKKVIAYRLNTEHYSYQTNDIVLNINTNKRSIITQELSNLNEFVYFPQETYCGVYDDTTLSAVLHNLNTNDTNTVTIDLNTTELNKNQPVLLSFPHLNLSSFYRISVISVLRKPLLGYLVLSDFRFITIKEEYEILISFRKEKVKLKAEDKRVLKFGVKSMTAEFRLSIVSGDKVVDKYSMKVFELIELIIISKKECMFGDLICNIDFLEEISEGALATASPELLSLPHKSVFKGLIHEISRFSFNFSYLFVFRDIVSNIMNWRDISFSLLTMISVIIIFTLSAFYDHILFLIPLLILILLTNTHQLRYSLEHQLKKHSLSIQDTQLYLNIKYLDKFNYKVYYEDTLLPSNTDIYLTKRRSTNVSLNLNILYLNLNNNTNRYALTIRVYNTLEALDFNNFHKLLDSKYTQQYCTLLYKKEYKTQHNSIFCTETTIDNIKLTQKSVIILEFVSNSKTFTNKYCFLTAENINTTKYKVYNKENDENLVITGECVILVYKNYWFLEDTDTKELIVNGNEFNKYNKFMIKEDCWEAQEGRLIFRIYDEHRYIGYAYQYISDILLSKEEHQTLTLQILNDIENKEDIGNWLRLLSLEKKEELRDYDITKELESELFGEIKMKVSIKYPHRNAIHNYQEQQLIKKTENINIFEPNKAYNTIQHKLQKIVLVISSINNNIEQFKNLFLWVHPQKTQFVGRISFVALIVCLLIESRYIVMIVVLFLMTEYFRPKGIVITKLKHFLSLLPNDEQLRSFYQDNKDITTNNSTLVSKPKHKHKKFTEKVLAMFKKKK